MRRRWEGRMIARSTFEKIPISHFVVSSRVVCRFVAIVTRALGRWIRIPRSLGPGRRRGLVRGGLSRLGTGAYLSRPVVIGRHSRREAPGADSRREDDAPRGQSQSPGVRSAGTAASGPAARSGSTRSRRRRRRRRGRTHSHPSGAATEAVGGPAAAIAGLAAFAPTAVALVPSSSAARRLRLYAAVVSARGAAGVGARRGVEPAALVAAVAPPARLSLQTSLSRGGPPPPSCENGSDRGGISPS